MNAAVTSALPKHFDLYYGGRWYKPAGGYAPTLNQANQQLLALAAEANTADMGAAVKVAHEGLLAWKQVPAQKEGNMLREISRCLRANNAHELTLLDSGKCGNPIAEMGRDVLWAAAHIDYYACSLAGIKIRHRAQGMPRRAVFLNANQERSCDVVGSRSCRVHSHHDFDV